MAKKYEIPETDPESFMVNEPPIGGYESIISQNQTELDADVDFDLERAITMDELLIGVKQDLREMFKKGKK